MKFRCPRCTTFYDIDEKKLRRDKGKFKCRKCGVLIEIEFSEEEHKGTMPVSHKIPSELQEIYKKAIRGELSEIMNLCKELLKMGKFDLIIDFIKQLDTVYSSRPGIMIFLGEAYLGTGEFEMAEEVFSKVYEQYPDNLKAQRGLGISLFRKGEIKEARRILEKYLSEIKGEDEEIQKLMSYEEEESKTAEEIPEEKIEEDFTSFGDMIGPGEKETGEEDSGLDEERIVEDREISDESAAESGEDKLPETFDSEPEEKIGEEGVDLEEITSKLLDEISEEDKPSDISGKLISEDAEEGIDSGLLPEEMEFSEQPGEAGESGKSEEIEFSEHPEEVGEAKEEMEFSEHPEEAEEHKEETQSDEKAEEEELPFQVEEEEVEEGEAQMETRDEFESEKISYEEVEAEEVKEEEETTLDEVEFLGEESEVEPPVIVKEEAVIEEDVQSVEGEESQEISADEEMKSLEEELSSLLESDEEVEEKRPAKEKTEEEISFEDFVVEEEEEGEEEEEEEGVPSRRRIIIPVIISLFLLLIIGASGFYYYTYEYIGSLKNITGQKILYLSKGLLGDNEAEVKEAESILKDVEEKIGRGKMDVDEYERLLKEAAAKAPHSQKILAKFLQISLLKNITKKERLFKWQSDMLEYLKGNDPSSLVTEALGFILQNNSKEVKTIIDKLRSINPQPADSIVLVNALYKSEHYKMLIDYVNHLEESSQKNHPVLMFYNFLSLYRLGEKEKAVNYGRKLVSLYPAQKDIRVKLAMIYVKDYGDTEGAELLLPGQKGLSPDEEKDYYYTKMLIEWKKGNLKKTIKIGEEGIKKTGDVKLKAELLKVYEEAGEREKIEQLAQEIINDRVYKFTALAFLGDINMRYGDYMEASKYYSKYLAEKESDDISLKYAKSLFYQRNLKEALKIVENLLSKNPDNPSVNLLYARILVELPEKGDVQKAENIARAYLQKNITNAEARLILAKTFFKKGLKKEAIKEGLDILNFSVVTSKDVYLELADLFEKGGDIKDAIFSIKSFLKEDPKNTPALIKLAELYRKEKDYRRSLETYQKILKSGIEDIKILKAAAKTASNIGYLDSALKFLDRAQKINPSDQEIYEELGKIHMNSGNLEAASINFQRALSIKNDSAIAHNNLAKIYLKQGSIERALYHSEKAYRIKPDNTSYIILYAKILFKSGRTTEARNILEEKSQQLSSSRNFYALLGDIRLTLGDFDGAERILSEGLKKFRNDSLIISILAKLKFYQGELGKAKSMLLRILRRGADINVYFLLGKIYLEERNFGQSYRYFQRCISLDKNFSEAYYYAGIALKKLSRWKEARKYLTEAISIGLPKNIEEQARKELKFLR